MKISVITPNFNGGEFLERALRSVISQDYRDVEHIVMDGGSTDESLQIVDRYRQNLTKVVSEKDNGQYDAIGKGFARATGDILCWLNSDDIYFPWTMRVVARLFVDFPQVDWIMGVRCELRNDAVQGISNVTPFPRDVIRSGAFHPRGLGCIMQEGCFWRRSLYEKAGGISVEMAGRRRLRALDQVCQACGLGCNHRPSRRVQLHGQKSLAAEWAVVARKGS